MNSAPPSTPKHIAWLLPAGTLFFMCGILLGRITESILPGLLMLVLSLAALLLSRRWRRSFALMMAALSVGAGLGWQSYHPALPAEGEYAIRGTVVQEIVTEQDGQVKTLLSGVTLNGQSAFDAYWTFYLDRDEALPEWLVPGSHVELTARVYHPKGRDNPGGFDFREYLLQRGVEIGVYGKDGLAPATAPFSLRGTMAALRSELTLRLMTVMGDETGAYAAAMLLGTRDFIHEDDRAAFQALGITHILSVSGYHVGVLAGLLLMLLRPLPVGRRVRFAGEGLLLGAYCILTGGNAPVIRAVLLLLWREFTRLRNRQIVPLHGLCITAAVQLAFNPSLLTSASFQLTYCAMLGLLLVHPWLSKQLALRTAWRRRLWEAFCAALSAQLGILMPQLYWFGELPLASLLLNILVIPLAGAIMGLYWLTLAALPIPSLGTLLGTLSARATTLLLGGIRWLAALDFTTLWTRQADAFTFAGWVLLLLGMTALVPRKPKRLRRSCLLLGAALTALILLPLPERDGTYTQFSVGNADAALLQDGDMTVVIDAGEDGQALAGYLHQQRQSVELLILTHLHTDHAGGLRALLDQGIPVEVCCLPADAEIPAIDGNVLPLLEELAATGTEFRTLSRGDVIGLNSGALTVLWPEAGRVSAAHDANDVCLVLQAEIGGVTMLLTGDLSGMYEKYAAAPSDVLKVAHHGSASSTSAEFLAAVDPQLLLLSNGDEKREVRMAELAGDTLLLSTEQVGAITLRFMGNGEYVADPFLPE